METPQTLDAPRYGDGLVVKTGDKVFVPSEQVQALVTALIQSPEQQAEWSVSEPGVMFEAQEFGLLFIPTSILKEHPLERR